MKKAKRMLAGKDRRSIYKLLLLMKFTIALLLFASLHVSAKTYSQDRITLKLQSAELKTALKQIEKQSIYRFLYNDDVISAHRKVSIDANNALVTEVLAGILTETSLTFKVLENNLVVITQKDFVFQETKVSGRVAGPDGQGVPSVTVKIKGSNAATTTDGNGNYSITVPDGATLVFSSVGYLTQEVVVSGRTEINVNLQIAAKDINEVVVIGYGTANKRDLTGSITKISGKEIADKPNTNPVASLQSKVAGLSVVNSATPGAAPDIRIRGTVSIGSVKPLYVVDGIFNDNIDYINPNDIESIEVLKDPSSLAIFGVKGASGVIAVTTKKAKSGQVLINANFTYGSKSLVDKIAIANRDEFISILTQEGKNRFNDNGYTNINTFVASSLPNWTGNTDWVDVLTRKATFSSANVSITGSTDKNKFYMGLGYLGDEGLVKNVKYQRYNISVNDEFKVSNAIKVGFNITGSREIYPYNADGLLADSRRLTPIADAGTKNFYTKNPYGTDSANYNLYSVLPSIQNTLTNPLLTLNNKWDKTIDNQDRVVASVFAEINFLRKFNFRATVYGDVGTRNTKIYTPLYDAYTPEPLSPDAVVLHINPLTTVEQQVQQYKKYQQDYILNYKNTFGDHGLTLTGGFTTYYYGYFPQQGKISQGNGEDPIPNDPRFWYLSSGFGNAQSASGSTEINNVHQHENATISGLFRALYSFKGKYFLNASVRRDVSSQIYNPDTRAQNFWAVGAAWELTKESFMDNQKFFNFLKLKASTGILGNYNTLGQDYPFFPTVSVGSSAVFGGNVVNAYSNDFLVDKNLKWETVNSKEVGVEFSAVNNRLHGEINYYKKDTKNLLVFLRPTGFLPTLTNNGSLTNSGFEFSASWTQPLAKDLNLFVSGNLSTFKNKVTSLRYALPADEQYPRQTEAGYPIGYFYGYVVEGVYQSNADILKSPTVFVGGGAQPGDLKYADLDGNDSITTADRKLIGNPTPDFTYGASINLSYKNFSLGIDVGGVYGNEIYRYWSTSENKYSLYNYPKYLLNAWNGPGTSNWVPIVDDQHGINRLPSTFGIEDGSYFRIRNVNLGYMLPTKTLNKAHIKSMKVFVNIQNLKTWKHNLGYSPEFGGSATDFGTDIGDANSALPRVMTFGLNVTF